jgi:hypothetical protein
MDLVTLFPEDMDIERNLRHYLASPAPNKLDRYFGTTEWRDIAAMPTGGGRGRTLRELYKERLQRELGYREVAHRDRAIRNKVGLELYKLIYASRHELGRTIWESVNRTGPRGQEELYFGPDI